MKEKLKVVFQLSKIRITFAVMLTTIVGYVLANGGYSSQMIMPVFGLFILACGSAMINQYQEHKRDAMMERTAHRPIPSGRISPANALILALSFVLAGSAMILFGSNYQAMLLGVTALLWYNTFYTPLKKITPFAVIPGSVIGALPPMVGWVAAGGSLTDIRALMLALFFFIWQVPHFWLLMIKYGPQYEKAGFPSLTRYYSVHHIRWVTFLWTFSTAVAALMLPAFGVVSSLTTAVGIILVSTWLIFSFVKILKFDLVMFKPMQYFMKINIFVLLMIILLSVDSFL